MKNKLLLLALSTASLLGLVSCVDVPGGYPSYGSYGGGGGYYDNGYRRDYDSHRSDYAYREHLEHERWERERREREERARRERESHHATHCYCSHKSCGCHPGHPKSGCQCDHGSHRH